MVVCWLLVDDEVVDVDCLVVVWLVVVVFECLCELVVVVVLLFWLVVVLVLDCDLLVEVVEIDDVLVDDDLVVVDCFVDFVEDDVFFLVLVFDIIDCVLLICDWLDWWLVFK